MYTRSLSSKLQDREEERADSKPLPNPTLWFVTMIEGPVYICETEDSRAEDTGARNISGFQVFQVYFAAIKFPKFRALPTSLLGEEFCTKLW
jgi:hypothetical protein